MFCPHLNSYLQLVSALSPRVINRSVAAARANLAPDDSPPHPRRYTLTHAQPSLYAPHVDVTRARLGYGRIGLRKLNRELHHTDPLVQLQALHTILDQVQFPESAFFLIHLHVVYRLIDLMLHENAVVREKVCLILKHLANIYQGRKAILSRKAIIRNLMTLIVKDPKKEVRFAAAFALDTICRERCAVETVLEVEKVIGDLLDMVRSDHVGIALLHLRTLANLLEWDQEEALQLSAFHIMLALYHHEDQRVAVGALACARQLLKHPTARGLADEHDLVFVLHDLLDHPNIEVIMRVASLLEYATLTTRSKFRARERCARITGKLVELCHSHNKPPLQLSCLRTLINLCDLPDIRAYLKANLLDSIYLLPFRTHEQWDGTSETTSYGLETGHNYRTMCIENVETIRNDFEDVQAVDVHSYLATLLQFRDQLVESIRWKPYP